MLVPSLCVLMSSAIRNTKQLPTIAVTAVTDTTSLNRNHLRWCEIPLPFSYFIISRFNSFRKMPRITANIVYINCWLESERKLKNWMAIETIALLPNRVGITALSHYSFVNIRQVEWRNHFSILTVKNTDFGVVAFEYESPQVWLIGTWF